MSKKANKKGKTKKQETKEEIKDNNNNNSTTNYVSLGSKTHHKKSGTRKYYLPIEINENIKQNMSIIEQMTKEFKDLNNVLVYSESECLITISGDHIDVERTQKILNENCGNAFTEAEFLKLVDDLASIELKRKDLLANPPLTISKCIKKAEEGVLLTKHNAFGSDSQVWFLIIKDRLYWKDKKKSDNHLNRSFEMKLISKIVPGKTTKTLKSKKLSKLRPDYCFSVVGLGKTLDFSAKNRQLRDEWFTYLEFTWRHYVAARKNTQYLDDADNVLDMDVPDID
mmetsp:Transcript_50622/g.62056  ORF Transcript_50622/g.62056 Transcript_50622/m.62056 type:complete len:283 (+) Transcript_50622:50-898(+)